MMKQKRAYINHKFEKKSTHTGHSLACRFNNPPPKKRWVIHNLRNRDVIKYHEKQGITEEIDNLKWDLQLGFIPKMSSLQVPALT